MTLQVLVATMHQTDYSIIEKMNIQSDAVIVNQCDCDSVTVFKKNGYSITWICTKERGVGRSRNRAILASTADIILFADEDVVYEDGYKDKVLSVFKNHRDYALVTFNLKSTNPDRPEYLTQKDSRIHIYNCLRYGACRMAVKRSVLCYKNVWFSLLFGGGAKYQCGEDNIFMTQCLQNGIKCWASSQTIGIVCQEQSTWFKGYNDQYYYDRGVLFSVMYRKWAFVYLFIFELKETILKKKSNKTLFQKYRLGMNGIRDIKKTTLT
ncbi:MAG: glycosyltransferase family A protein [Clostridiales bacterium]|nr:glycosyltransferase family A protein [Clostridiales bacterium]